MENPHDINCECDCCKYTRYAVRQTMLERDQIIKDLTAKIDYALEAFRDTRLSVIEAYKKGVKILVT